MMISSSIKKAYFGEIPHIISFLLGIFTSLSIKGIALRPIIPFCWLNAYLLDWLRLMIFPLRKGSTLSTPPWKGSCFFTKNSGIFKFSSIWFASTRKDKLRPGSIEIYHKFIRRIPVRKKEIIPLLFYTII